MQKLINKNISRCLIFSACSVVGIAASYWNCSVFPETCTDSTVDNKTTYNTMTRIGWTWGSFGNAVMAIMNNYGWQHVVLITPRMMQSMSSCTLGGSSIYNKMSNMKNITLSWIQTGPRMDDDELKFAFDQIAAKARGKKTAQSCVLSYVVVK
jgi:Receptor family ligand binding region